MRRVLVKVGFERFKFLIRVEIRGEMVERILTLK
jgi:hypothetical protein